MPDLHFAIAGVAVVPHTAVPTLGFALQVRNANQGEAVHSVALRCQIQIAATRRRYGPDDHERLLDLFGEPDRWGETMRSLLWTHVNMVVPSFVDSAEASLHVPCSFDFNVAATKYFYALEAGSVPLLFLFSGSVFYAGPGGALQVGQISWEREADFALPVEVWKQLMAAAYPNSAWLQLQHDVFDRLYRYKMRRGLPTWEQTLASLLPDDEPQTDAPVSARHAR